MIKGFTVSDCQLVQLPKITTEAGSITSVNNLQDISFEVKRVYYLYDIPGGETRGGHAHKTLRQIMVAGSGSFDCHLDDGSRQVTFHLNRPYLGLEIKPGIWRHLSNFSAGAICLVLASELYSEEDYYREYEQFRRSKLA